MSRLSLSVVFLLILGLLAGCGRPKGERRPPESMSEGHATIGASDAVYDVAAFLAQEFRGGNPNAFIDVFRDTDRALIDSLVNRHVEEIFLDRALTPAETTAFKQATLKLFQYPVAYFPVYLLVKNENDATSIDSAELRGVLTGAIDSWKPLGGPDRPVNVYLPAPGDGPWVSIMSYFGRFDSIQATVCSTATAMLDSARDDPGALLVFARPVDDIRNQYTALYFDRGNDLLISPNVKTILDSLGYPFRLDLTYVTTHNKVDVATGYLTFIVGNLGQRRLMDALHYRPASVPVRMVRMRGGGNVEAE